MTTFYDLIDRLTRTAGSYPVHIRDAKGNLTRETRHLPGLLIELRSEVFLGMEGVGGSSSFGSRPPIDAGALDLLTEITNQATEALAAVTHTPPAVGHAEDYVRQWAARTTEHERFTVSSKATVDDAGTYAGQQAPFRPVVYEERTQLTAYQLAQRWCDRIDEYFNPPSAREIQVECPECHERYHHRFKDGQHVRSSALNFIRERQSGEITEAKCSVCGTSWSPAMFERLAVLIGGKTFAQVQEELDIERAAEDAKASKRRRSAA